jgi:hypothetical protein
MRIFLAVVLTAAITAPAVAQYGSWGGGTSAPRDYAPNARRDYVAPVRSGKSDRARATGSYAQEYRGSPHSPNPQFDVYVNGVYVGSDPDPRIRSTLAHEWRSQGGLR